MIHNNRRTTLIATLVIVSMTAASFAVPMGGVGSAAAAPTASSPHGATANYTFSPDNRAPGNQNGAANHFASGLEEDLSALHYVVVRSEAFDFSDCSAQKTEAFGIDRGNDDPGTQTDESLLTAYKNIDFRSNSIVVEFYKEDALAGQPKAINTEDQIVARGVDCYDNPDEAGWYQVQGMVNGSTKASDSPETDYTISTKTHYIYVCDCDSRQEAVDKLGPPPSEQSSDGSGDGTPTAESTPEPTAESTPESTETDGGADGGDDSTETSATPTSEGDDESTSTSTDGTPATDGDSPTTDDSAVTDDDAATDDGSTVSPANDQGGDGATPTDGGGPGFGVLVALGSLMAVAALQRRRTD